MSRKPDLSRESGPDGFSGPLPDGLREIRDAVLSFQDGAGDREKTRTQWEKQMAALERAVPAVVVAHEGQTVRLGDLSPGCAACKAGQWDCIFATMDCNLNCDFCLKPEGLALPPMFSALGDDLDLLCRRYEQAGVTGVSFSGGEPFLYPEPVLRWISVLRSRMPGIYLWAYTNGIPLDPALLGRLAEAGLDELRFNLAASGYADQGVHALLKEACRRIPAVAVEVPAVPEQEHLIMASLQSWIDAGVKYLNLHELIHEEGSNSFGMQGARAPCVMPDGHPCQVNPESAALIQAVFQKVSSEKLPLAVNGCGMPGKACQMKGRRRMLSRFTLRPHERLCRDGTAESACLFRDHEVEWLHPDGLEARKAARKGWSSATMRRLLPLDLRQPGQWISLAFNPGDHDG